MTSCKHLNHKHRATGLQPECSWGTNMQSESRRVTGCTGNIRKLLFFTRSLHLRYKTQKIYRTYSEDTELQKRSPFTRQTQVSQNFRCSHLQLQQNGRSFALDLHLFGIRFLHCFFTRDPFRFVSTLNFITWPENNRRLPCRGANRNNLWQNLLILLDSAKFNKGMQLEVTRVGNQRHNFMKFSPLAMQPVSRVPIQTFHFAFLSAGSLKGWTCQRLHREAIWQRPSARGCQRFSLKSSPLQGPRCRLWTLHSHLAAVHGANILREWFCDCWS